MAITFKRVKDYLNAIEANGNVPAANAPHGVWWNIDYPSFVNGVVPTKICNGAPVPILNHGNLTQSAFFLILQHGWCGAPPMPQMPLTGPFITSPGYSVQLPDGTAVTGAQIIKDLGDWLAAGAPEN